MAAGMEAGACRVIVLRRRTPPSAGSQAPAEWTAPAGSLPEVRATLAGLAAARDATPGAALLIAFEPSAETALSLDPTVGIAAPWVTICLGPGGLGVIGSTAWTMTAGTLVDLGSLREVELRCGAAPCQVLLLELVRRPSWREMFAVSGG